MKLAALNSFDIDKRYIVEFEDQELQEQFEVSIAELLNEAKLPGASVRSMTHADKKDTRYIKKEIDKTKLIKTVKDTITTAYKAAWAKPVKKPRILMRVRFLTGGPSDMTKIPKILKGAPIGFGGRPKEIRVYPPTSEDVAKKAENEAAGTSHRKAKLSPTQIRVKQSNLVGDWQTISLQHLMGVVLKNVLYMLKGSESKINEYAATAAPVLVDLRKKARILAAKYNFREPGQYTVEQLEKRLADVVMKPRSNASRDKKAFVDAANKRKEAGQKDDYSISIHSFQDGKVVTHFQIAASKIAANYGVPKLTASTLPDGWLDTHIKSAWGKRVKEIKQEVVDDIQKTMGSKSLVSFDTNWINIYHQKEN